MRLVPTVSIAIYAYMCIYMDLCSYPCSMYICITVRLSSLSLLSTDLDVLFGGGRGGRNRNVAVASFSSR